MSFSCKLCNNTTDFSFISTDAKSKQPLSLSVCLTCSLVQLTDLPSEQELTTYYTYNYRTEYKNTSIPKLKHIRRAGLAAIARLNFLTPTLTSQHKILVDIGAGGGEFVYLAQKHGYTALGIEPNQNYANFACKGYKINLQSQMLDHLTLDPCDVVTLFHVYEHMSHPLQVMGQIAQILKQDGLLFIEVPNILQQDASPHNIFFKAHLFYYSAETLIAAASQYFDPIKLSNTGNLRIIFKKKSLPHEIILPPQIHVQTTLHRLKTKGWLEYLCKGGGLLKPFKKLSQMIMEHKVAKINPKDLLDYIYATKL